MTKQYNEPRCKICQHPDRETIDEALMEGIKTNRELCKIYGLSENAMSVHKHKHLLTQDMREQMRELMKKSIMEGQFKIENAGDWIRIAEYLGLDLSLNCGNCPKNIQNIDLGKKFLIFREHEVDLDGDLDIEILVRTDLFDKIKDGQEPKKLRILIFEPEGKV